MRYADIEIHSPRFLRPCEVYKEAEETARCTVISQSNRCPKSMSESSHSSLVVIEPADKPTSSTEPAKMSKTVKVGAVQAEPAWLDLQGGVTKVVALIEEAAKNGTNVLGFPEVFIPGYPWWALCTLTISTNMLRDDNRTIWTDSPLGNTAFIHEYMANSMQKESPEMDRIRAAVKKAGIFIVLGYSERAGGSLYIAQVST